MSIAPFLAGASKFLGAGGIAFEATRQIGSLLGFGNGENIARNLSADLGCQIPQAQAAAARGFVAKGINPCTMQPLTPDVAAKRPEAPRGAVSAPAAPARPVITVPPGGNGMSVQAGMIGGGGALVRAGAAVVPGLIRTATGRISSIVLPSGQKFSRKRAAQLIKRVGFQTAAAALGVGIIELAEILLADAETTARRRRGRGITAAQVRNARRTACAVSRLARDLQVKPAPARRRTCR